MSTFLQTYCTNVHAGRNLAETEANIERFSTPIPDLIAAVDDDSSEIGLGLWLSATSARELRESDGAGAFRDRIRDRGLRIVTLNGFPYGDFHAEVVEQLLDSRSAARAC